MGICWHQYLISIVVAAQFLRIPGKNFSIVNQQKYLGALINHVYHKCRWTLTRYALIGMMFKIQAPQANFSLLEAARLLDKLVKLLMQLR